MSPPVDGGRPGSRLPIPGSRRSVGSRRLLLKAALVAPATGLFTARAAADRFPTQPVRIVVGYAPGGGVDLVARIVARPLAEVLGRTVLVENRSGASGSLGADLVARAPADGHTLLMASPAEVIVGPAAGQRTPYSPTTAFTGIAVVGETPLAIAVHPSVGVDDLAGLARQSRDRPGTISYGTPGAGSPMHFAGESLAAGLDLDMTHVAYRGAAPMITDLVGGQVQVGIAGLPPLLPHVAAGRLRLLAVTTAEWSSLAPSVPAVAELPMLSGFRFSNWMTLFVPAGTATDRVGLLAARTRQVLDSATVRQQLGDAGVEPIGQDGLALAAFLAGERDRYAAVAHRHGIRYAD